MLSGERVPQYGRIIAMLSDAIDEITQATRQTQFEWLPEATATSSKPNVLERLMSWKLK